MKEAYPIVLTMDEGWYVVYVPDFQINTQGTSIVDAIEMARDAIGLVGIVREDKGKGLPEPSPISAIKPENEGDIVTLVDVDFVAYRRKNDKLRVKKNCTIPNWLCYAAEQENINFSEVLTEALKRELDVKEPD